MTRATSRQALNRMKARRETSNAKCNTTADSYADNIEQNSQRKRMQLRYSLPFLCPLQHQQEGASPSRLCNSASPLPASPLLDRAPHERGLAAELLVSVNQLFEASLYEDSEECSSIVLCKHTTRHAAFLLEVFHKIRYLVCLQFEAFGAAASYR